MVTCVGNCFLVSFSEGLIQSNPYTFCVYAVRTLKMCFVSCALAIAGLGCEYCRVGTVEPALSSTSINQHSPKPAKNLWH